MLCIVDKIWEEIYNGAVAPGGRVSDVKHYSFSQNTTWQKIIT